MLRNSSTEWQTSDETKKWRTRADKPLYLRGVFASKDPAANLEEWKRRK